MTALLGAWLDHGHAPGAAISIVAIFLPGVLLISGVLPFCPLVTHPGIAQSMAEVNAAVIGLLAAALYDPLWSAVCMDQRISLLPWLALFC